MWKSLSLILSIYSIENVFCCSFDYPDEMPDNQIVGQAILLASTDPYISLRETPMQLRTATSVDTSLYNCIAVYESTPLDVLTKKAPIVRADSDTITNNGTAETKLLCGYYAVLIVLNDIMPDWIPDAQALYDGFGLDSSLTTVDSDVAACDVTDAACLEDVASANNYCPEIMASIVAYQLLNYLDNDGWNAKGKLNGDGSGPCTANCRNFADTTGYEPQTDDMNRWQRLQEDNGLGFFYSYDHVTPHIGFTAKTRFTTRETLKARKSPDPEYIYKDEVEDVLDRLEDLATNDTKKMMVEYFDNKIAVLVAILDALDNLLPWTYEERAKYLVGYGFAEFDAVIHAWREKRIWDLVRPTTLIKSGLAGDTVTTYGGPYQGVQTIDAQDFESYIRVMPHSEYPSGSGCLCLAAVQYVDKILKDRYGITEELSVPISFPPPFIPYFPAGSSSNEPGEVPAEDLYITLNLEEINYFCGESRLWGGMHFTAAIQGSYDLCDGVGVEAFEFMENILSGNEAAFGDEEEIPPFEEEYEEELKLTLGKKYKKGKKKHKKRRKN